MHLDITKMVIFKITNRRKTISLPFLKNSGLICTTGFFQKSLQGLLVSHLEKNMFRLLDSVFEEDFRLLHAATNVFNF